jgi:hypothetical protein
MSQPIDLAYKTSPPSLTFGVQTLKVIQAIIQEPETLNVYESVLERTVWLLCLVLVDGTCIFYNSAGAVHIDFEHETEIVKVAKVTIGTMPASNWVRQIEVITTTAPSPSNDSDGRANGYFGQQEPVDPELEWISEVVSRLFKERQFDEYIKRCDEQSAKIIGESKGGIPSNEPVRHVFVDADGWQLLHRYIEGWVHTDKRGVVTTGRDRLDKWQMMKRIRDMVEGVNEAPVSLEEWGRNKQSGIGKATDLF